MGIVRDSFLGRFLLSELHVFESKLLPLLISDEKAVRRYYKKRTGKNLNLENPMSYSEKLNWYKLNCRLPLMQQCADKVAVREYVKLNGYENLLNKQYCICDKISDLHIENLPTRFVLKAAHGSSMNLVVKDKTKIHWVREKIIMWTWLHQDIAWSGREWVYKDMPKRLIAEKYLEDENGELRDYKFFCFNGKPVFMQYDVGRFLGKHARNFYDMDGNLFPLHDDHPSDSSLPFPLPKSIYSEMQVMAAKLARPFQFVRVDFYYVIDKIFFGEMTFFPHGGIPWFQPPEYDMIFGKEWKLVLK